jgi:hypothetical protein
MPRRALRLHSVEWHLMSNSNRLKKINYINKYKILVPCLLTRPLVVEQHLMHNSNKLK